ncbi:MAG: 2-C-methyl-D-erythritol 4-phosphate cytidylyltransferase [Candidatus Riflebacteria bacterium]|nr:2-C-methyl-D-erythritol 4-phosphate cytidylyltransferase [Candidatus Riflebacteria bacterium]
MLNNTRIAAIVVAGGMGIRMNSSVPKQFMELGGRPVLQWSLECFNCLDLVDEIILVLPADRIAEGRALLSGFVAKVPFNIVAGGERRQDSVMQGLCAVTPPAGWVMVHDAARPGMTSELARAALLKAEQFGNAVCAVPSQDTLVKANAGKIVGSLDRREIFRLQTPQIFRCDELLAALKYANSNKLDITDESSIMARLGYEIFLAEGSEQNNKITGPQDFEILGALLARQHAQVKK